MAEVTGRGERERRWWTASELLATPPAPLAWVVPGLLLPGLTVAAAVPKIGLSWLLLDVAVAVSSGGHALGQLQAGGGPALGVFLALEDHEERMRRRLSLLLGRRTLDELTVSVSATPLQAGGAERLDQWLTHHPGTRLLVVDRLARLRRGSGRASYLSDHEAMSLLRELADKHHCAVLVAHHMRKEWSADPLGGISGTYGVSGAPDAAWVLSRARGEPGAALWVTGRDFPEATHPLRFDSCRWSMRAAAPPAAARRGKPGAPPLPSGAPTVPSTELVLAELRATPGSKPADVARATGLRAGTVRQALTRLLDAGRAERRARGSYYAREAEPTAR